MEIQLNTESLAPVMAQMGIVFETPEEIVSTLQAYAIEILENQEVKIYLEQDEVAALDKDVRMLQARIIKLEQLKSDFNEYIKKGSISDIQEKLGSFIQVIRSEDVLSNAEGYSFHPPTLEGIGVESLKKQIKFKTELAERGYTKEKADVFGIANNETKMIDYVTAQGNPSGIPSKPMTIGQMKQYTGG